MVRLNSIAHGYWEVYVYVFVADSMGSACSCLYIHMYMYLAAMPLQLCSSSVCMSVCAWFQCNEQWLHLPVFNCIFITSIMFEFTHKSNSIIENNLVCFLNVIFYLETSFFLPIIKNNIFSILLTINCNHSSYNGLPLRKYFNKRRIHFAPLEKHKQAMEYFRWQKAAIETSRTFIFENSNPIYNSDCHTIPHIHSLISKVFTSKVTVKKETATI